MSDRTPEIITQSLNGFEVRTTRIENTDYVSMQDFCLYLQGLIGKIVELTQRQQEHITSLNTSLEVVCEVLARKHPDLERALLEAAERRTHLV